MLRNSTLTVSEFAITCGYVNLEIFSRAHKTHFGEAPSRDRRK